MYYILINGEPVEETDLIKWASWVNAEENKLIQKDQLLIADDYVLVSTVFLGVDRQYKPGGFPLLFETLIQGLDGDPSIVQHETRDQALLFHQGLVAGIKELQGVLTEVPQGFWNTYLMEMA